MDWFRRSVGTFQSAWAGFPVSTRIVTGFLLALLALVSVWGITAAGREGWVRIVDSGDAVDDRARIIAKLKEIGIETRVAGESISVPASQADKAMLQLHGSGVLGDESFFRFLKETDLFGTADKSSKQWLVALQGRLAAMIQGLDYVRTARVQIAQVADKSLWWADGRESTAAVQLGLEPAESMSSSRVRGIAALVSAAVPGLKPSGVKILDQKGQFFRVDDNDSAMTDEHGYAAMIETKVLWILPRESRVSAQVRLKVEKQGATVESIHVAVLVPDDAQEVPVGEAERQVFIRNLKDHVRAAAGAQEKDPISIRIAPLTIAREIGTGPAPQRPDGMSWWQEGSSTLFLFVLGTGALFAVVRLVRGLAPRPDGGVMTEESLRAPGESILSAQDDALDRIRDGVRESVARNPREAADVARKWMAP